MKTILFLIPSLGGGGAERVLTNLVNNLDKKKYDVTVQTLFDVGVNRQYLNSDVEYIAGFRKQMPGNVMLFKLFSPETLYRRIVRKKYDIVISYLEGPTARIVAGCPYQESKLVSWIHVEQHSMKNAAYSFRSETEAQKCYEAFDKIICVAESVKRDFCSIFSIKQPCEVLYNTNEDDYVRSQGQESLEDFCFSNQLNVVSVGRLRLEKGYDRLINVHKRLIDQGFYHHVYVIGEGSEESDLRAQIKENHIDDTFHLIGFHQNPYKFVAKADLFVCSSRREGFSTAVTEALILGIPVVSTCCSGAYELLGENNEYGIVTENNEQGIYDGMYQMISNRSLLEHYRTKAEERGRFFSKENTVKAVENMLDRLS